MKFALGLDNPTDYSLGCSCLALPPQFPRGLGLQCSSLPALGCCGMVAITWYASNITRDFFDPLYPGTK